MERYEERKVIGRGSYGTAHLVRDVKTGTKLVVKKIPLLNLTPKEKRDAESEVKFLSQLHHPNIVEYRDSFVQADTLHIVTQYCELGDLSHLIKQKRRKHAVFQEKQIVDWFIQIAMAVDHIHSLNIMHRDLKTGNVFLTKTNVVKLGDFGIAKVLNCTLDQAHTMVGTPYFMSPEVCENKQYDKKSDLWAMGCILYELCTLSHAFDASNLLGLVLKIIQESYTPIPNHYSPELRDLVRSLLSKNPSHRPSCRKIFRLPFIRNRLETLAKASTLGTTPDEKCQPIGTPPQNAEQDVPPPPPLPLAEPETMPPPPPRVLPRNLMVNCPPKTSSPDYSKDATTEKDTPNKQPKVLGVSRLQNGMREQSLTPSAMVKERKEAAIREREEILREANRKNAQSRLEARRRSGQQFQVSADNLLMGEGSESHDCNDSSGVSNPEVSREQGFPGRQGESRHLMSPVATRHHAAAHTPTTPQTSHYTDHQIMPHEDHFEMKTGDMHLHAKELNRAPNMTRRRSLGGAPYAGGTVCNCNNCASCISGRNGMPTPTPASASGEWNDSVQIGSARLPLTPGSIPRPQRRQRKPRSASGSCPASMLSSNQLNRHTRCHSTSGPIYQTNSHSSTNAQVPTRRRSGSTVSMGAVSGSGNIRSPGGMGGMFGSPLHRSPMLQPNRRPRRIPENSRIKRSVLLNDPTPQQISAVAAAAAVHKATYNERQTHAVAIEHSKAPPEPISSPRCRLAELEHQELERADALKVLDECKRRACNKELAEPAHSNAEITEKERPPLVPSSSQQRPDWIKIAAKHRKRLVALLGFEDFQNIYTYLSNLHAAGRESSAKESRKELLKFVCKDKLALAFEVDQLLFMEGVHCQK